MVREAAHVWVVNWLRFAVLSVCDHVVHKPVPIFPGAEPKQQHHRAPERLEVGLLVDGTPEPHLSCIYISVCKVAFSWAGEQEVDT